MLEDPAALATAYESASIETLARRLGVAASTVRRALVHHGIARAPRNRSRLPIRARRLDDPAWLADQYRTRTAVEIADELGVASTTVYRAMRRHRIGRRARPGRLALKQTELTDTGWLALAMNRDSSRHIAAELGVSAGTVRAAYALADIDPAATTALFERGRKRSRPTIAELRAAWAIEGSFRGVGRRLGAAHTTAAVWLAEIGVYANPAPVLSRRALLDAIERRWPIAQIAAEHNVSTTTVRSELHRHGLFERHRRRHLA